MGGKFYPVVGLLIISATLLASNAVATQFTVGGSGDWTAPNNNNAVYNQWAEKMRFQIGDSLLFVYHTNSDSLLEVTKPDYDSCNTASPLKKYTDGHTVVKFDHSGPHYFISGNKDNCQKNEKLLVVVMADRTGGKEGSSTPPPAASPPSPSSTAQSPPAPAPAAPVPSSSPPPAPSTLTPHPKNEAVKGIASSVGALTGIAFLIIAS